MINPIVFRCLPYHRNVFVRHPFQGSWYINIVQEECHRNVPAFPARTKVSVERNLAVVVEANTKIEDPAKWEAVISVTKP